MLVSFWHQPGDKCCLEITLKILISAYGCCLNVAKKIRNFQPSVAYKIIGYKKARIFTLFTSKKKIHISETFEDHLARLCIFWAYLNFNLKIRFSELAQPVFVLKTLKSVELLPVIGSSIFKFELKLIGGNCPGWKLFRV